ncbi:hypothetical protein COU60_03135 [Candidatus Pacearchaeota archaeon CG10_big_fil_rev_8_21_14_0_10_34_76]|nr:MAG: hypothetical protein COU60_03135 [Candidatus Pacearchaeota archaeon CG10_big_fil_rev_8_21_14_0_10_34_76]
MIKDLKNNIETEIKIVEEMSHFMNRRDFASPEESRLIDLMIGSYQRKVKIINNSIDEIVKNISLVKKIPGKDVEPKIEKISISPASADSNVKSKEPISERVEIVLKKVDKGKFIEELSISEELLKKLKKRKKIKGEKVIEYKKSRGYPKLANSFFRSFSNDFLLKEKFSGLISDLRKSNLNILPVTYISMMFLGLLISIFVAFFVMVFFIFFEISFTFPFISAYSGSYFARIFKVSWILAVIPIITGLSFYFYPYSEKKSLGSRIDRELPFVAIHMASISGSGIEPSQIFKIIALSQEYRYTASEVRKILNQINIYGYDLVNALKNVANSSPSAKLSELLKGLATSIMTGGNLNSFLEKRAETLLLNYRLEREKFAKTAETFMDIYISVVIAAPMILLLLLIMISVSGVGFGISTGILTLGIILIVAVVNILFLVLLGLKQPGY